MMLHFTTGLPTQAEINCWDDGQRARGHQMVKVLAHGHLALRRRLEAIGYEVAYGEGRSRTEALADLATELGVAL